MTSLRADRINRLAQIVGAQRYLEIGVNEGRTFFAVDIAEKVAVDPLFQFDHRARANATTVFHQMPSDDYFAGPARGRFDLIYLDGLHTYEQTLRDFLASLRHATDRTVWLIDDTVPNDRFAAIPDERECFRLRHATGNLDWSWMGDVYKVVFFIEAMMRDFAVSTFTGHGQTVVWRPGPSSAAHAGLPLDDIATLSYDAMCASKAAMRPAADAEIYAAVAAFAEATRPGAVQRLVAWTNRLRAGLTAPRPAAPPGPG